MSAIDLVKQPLRSRGLRGDAAESWETACVRLGIDFNRGAKACSGLVGGHPVSMSLVGSGSGVQTRFSVALDATHAPEFSIVQSLAGWMPSISLIELSFDEAVAIQCADEDAMMTYLTRERRQDILRSMERWPNATITNTEAVATVPGIEANSEEIVESLILLAVLAESLSPCWTEVAVDEGSVLGDLFKSTRTDTEIEQRFDRLYKGAEVTWTGEVVHVGDQQTDRQLAVVMIGSGERAARPGKPKAGTMWGGRVVALTRLDADSSARKGDVVTMNGALRDIDGSRRMFRIDDFESWKPRRRLLD